MTNVIGNAEDQHEEEYAHSQPFQPMPLGEISVMPLGQMSAGQKKDDREVKKADHMAAARNQRRRNATGFDDKQTNLANVQMIDEGMRRIRVNDENMLQ